MNVEQCLHFGTVDSDEMYCHAAVSKLSTQNKHSTFPVKQRVLYSFYSPQVLASKLTHPFDRTPLGLFWWNRTRLEGGTE